MRKRPTTTLHTPTIAVKRRPPARGFLKRLSAVTRGRNQRVAAAADDFEAVDHSSRISKGLTIIFGVHILAIGLYFFHLNFLSKRTEDPGSIAVPTEPKSRPAPQLAPAGSGIMVVRGDTYASIAKDRGIAEAALRAANGNRAFSAGDFLIAPPNDATTGVPASTTGPGRTATAGQTSPDDGLVDVDPVVTEPASEGSPKQPDAVRETVAPKAIPVKPTATAAGGSYKVRQGDSLWGISKRLKVDQAALMRANNISDPKKLKTGMVLKVPN